jgi:pSer/pThr/pTyr-binding forkhead associated (FHA) protein
VAAATFALRLPFDAVPLGDVTRIGRDAAWSSLAPRLQSYDMVSRRHAELRVREGRLFVVDVGSTHGVRVNDAPLSLHAEAELRPGDRVAFSRQLIGEIEFAARAVTP